MPKWFEKILKYNPGEKSLNITVKSAAAANNTNKKVILKIVLHLLTV